MRARRAEVQQLAPDLGGAQFSDARSRRVAAFAAGTAARDPTLSRVRRAAGRRTTVLDVGAGAGDFALALAPRVARVVAVEPDPAMVAVLRREARRRGLHNIEAVEGRWEDAEVSPAEVVVCSYVLPLAEDAAAFLGKLDRSCLRQAFVSVMAVSVDAAVDPFWRYFHGRPRRPAPSYLDALAVLAELGIAARVEVAEVPTLSRFTGERFATLAAAVAAYGQDLLLDDTPPVRRELRGLLRPWLVEEKGYLRPPVTTLPAAIISWAPRSSGPIR